MEDRETKYYEDKLIGLGEVRKGKAWLKQRKAEMLEVITESPEYKALLEEIELYEKDEFILEAQLRAAALADYIETGSKKPFPGIGIRVYQKLEISDQEAATDYIADKLPAAMKVDWKQAEKLVKAGVSIPGTELVENPKATLPKEITITRKENPNG
jgi:hypothetical protein